MVTSNLMNTLNPAQRAAVCAVPGHYLVLAGAGSGKTRVLIQRMIWLHQTYHVPLHHLFAVTFTNKAATEMRQRIDAQLAYNNKGLWVGTFHGLAHRLLRLHWQLAKLPQSFTIMGNYEQLRLVKGIAKTVQLEDCSESLKPLIGWINAQKEAGRRAQHIQPAFNNELFERYRCAYTHYQQHCENEGLVDFNELLLRAHELLRDNSELLAHYQQRFQYLLVDEFQDTNTIQYAFIRVLAGESGYIFAVGDDDQAIYSWRGAQIENIQRFLNDFPSAKTLRLEQNYRSTSPILNVANALIAHNAQRMGKHLWTESNHDQPVELLAAANEHDEADYLVQRAQQWVAQGGSYADIAVLYRTNNQSRAFERALTQAAIPYRIHSGLHFFERAEIRDALAWLRLLVNRNDDAAFERAIQAPKCGIGLRTLAQLQQMAQTQVISLWQASHVVIHNNSLTKRTRQALLSFTELITQLAHETHTLPLPELIEYVITRIALREYCRKTSAHELEGQSRCEHLDQLIDETRYFITDNTEDEGIALSELEAFLAYVALESGQIHDQKTETAVQLMTLHAAKGLEFPLVFLSGMEDGLLPSARSLNSSLLLNEERRLAYVGITRAQKNLILSYAKERHLYGKTIYFPRSRFLEEIPSNLVREIRPSTRNLLSQYHNNSTERIPVVVLDTPTLLPGTRISHPVYGEGTVMASQGSGTHERIHIAFDDEGSKWLLLAYADLKIIPD